MKSSRFSEPQILAILRQAERGVAVPDLCREHGMSTASFYKWRAQYGRMDASMISQKKPLEDENLGFLVTCQACHPQPEPDHRMAR